MGKELEVFWTVVFQLYVLVGWLVFLTDWFNGETRTLSLWERVGYFSMCIALWPTRYL